MATSKPFWANPTFEPARKNRFRIGYTPDPSAPRDEGDDTPAFEYWWWAQSVTLPSFEINEESYQMVNRRFKYPGLLSWNDVQIVLYEKGSEALKIMRLLKNAGYQFGSAKECGSGILKGGFSGNELIIEELKPSGKLLQSFTLLNWYLKAANFGELNYDDDGFVTITMTIGYDAAEIKDTNQSESGGNPGPGGGQ